MKATSLSAKIWILTGAVICFVMLLAAAAAAEMPSAETAGYVAPRMAWALSGNQSGEHSFTFGEGIHEFRFSPINIEKMKYLEFDIYLRDPDVVNHWKTGETELEITSSGTCDRFEYAWMGYELWKQAADHGLKLKTGWNHVILTLPESSRADFSRINYIRWYWNEDGPGRTMSGCEVANLRFTAAISRYQAAAAGEQPDGTVYNVIPRMEWTLNRNQSGRYAFTFGQGLHEFRFDPVDIGKMKYLEFDIYLPDPGVVNQWKTGDTEFEITSSGKCDISEYAWSGYSLWKQAADNGLELREGWNHVRLSLPKQSSADFSRINYIRWYWNEDGPNRTMAGCEIANLKFSVPNGEDPANAHPEPFIPSTVYETEDVPVALADVTMAPYFADPAGVKDSTKAIQNALDDVSLHGGGTVWMPAGTYRITGQIRIPAYVTLRGDWIDPDTAAKYGTVIAMDIPESDSNSTGTFTLSGCSGVYGLTIYYPSQSIDEVKPYPFAFFMAGHTGDSMMPSVINCTILNGYRGIGASTKTIKDPEDTGHENMYVMNFRGTFLSCGAESYNESDFGFWDDVKIKNKYWTEAARTGILQPVNESKLAKYTRTHTSGLILGDLEWVSMNNITIEDCQIGIHTVHGRRDGVEFQGLLYGFTAKNCGKGLVVDALYIDNGMVLAGSNIDGGLYNNTKTVIRMFNVKVTGAKKGRLREDKDYSLDLPVPGPGSGRSKPVPILYTAHLDSSGRTDVSAELQTLLKKAGSTGGVVYLPGGIYRLDSPVDVPAGVELKGTSATPTKDFPYGYAYNGTTLLSYYKGSGPDDRALITLIGKAAGISGLRINYPENRLHSRRMDKSLFETAYAVKGTAPDVYIVNSYIVASAYGVDFTNCDRHYIMALAACCYQNTIKVGGKDGIVRNCFQNPGMYYVSATPYVVLPNGFHSNYEPLSRNHSDYLYLENASGELVCNIAMFGAHNALVNRESSHTTVINLATDYLCGIQTIMDGGSLTVINAMRWDGKSFQHIKGLLRIYNRFEHGFSSGLNGDAVEETYVAEK